jgi:hypothetical protein
MIEKFLQVFFVSFVYFLQRLVINNKSNPLNTSRIIYFKIIAIVSKKVKNTRQKLGL